MWKPISIFAVFLCLNGWADITITNAPFNCIGDAFTFYANSTSNNLVITTTNNFTLRSGNILEADACGFYSNGGFQTLVCEVTNVVNGTNLYLNKIPQATNTGMYCTYGHDNSSNWVTVVNAASGTTGTNVIIPDGRYLTMGYNTDLLGNRIGIPIYSGGMNFIGQSQTGAVIVGQSAWSPVPGSTPYQGGRAWLVCFITPSNDFPVTFSTMTMHGGVDIGNTSIHGIAADPYNGTGWDQFHTAVANGGNGNANANTITHTYYSDVIFSHWRGEILKSTEFSTNGNASFTRCTWSDGNATAINYYPALSITNGTFTNLFQIAESYQAYATNSSIVTGCLSTNITGNGWAWNGSNGKNPGFTLLSNTFYFTSAGNYFATTPGCNISILGNNIYGGTSGNVFVLGSSGYQGTFCNSNINLGFNYVQNGDIGIQPGGSITPPDTNWLQNLNVFSNTFVNVRQPYHTYGYATNLHAWWNTFDTSDLLSGRRFDGVPVGTYMLFETNNAYPAVSLSTGTGNTNAVTYATGWSYSTRFTSAGSYFKMQTGTPWQIPVRSQVVFDNSLGSNPFHLLTAENGGNDLSIVAGQRMVLNWDGTAYQTNGYITPTAATFSGTFMGTISQ